MTAKTKPLAWAAWESPDRVIVRPDMKNETCNTLPRLLLIPFANGAYWVKDRIAKYQFVKNQDFAEFTPNLAKNQRGRGRPSSEYQLTLDMAKELSMVENNENGRQARRYFIECERKVAETLAGRRSVIEQSPAHNLITQAARSRAWRYAEEQRQAFMTAIGSAAKPGDDETAWGMSYLLMERIEERLLKMGMDMVNKHSPQSVANWLLNWRPETQPALSH